MSAENFPKKYYPLVKEFERWIKVFGLMFWDVRYVMVEMEGAETLIETDQDAHAATVLINKTLNPDPKYLKHCAFHEAAELLMAEVDWLMKGRFISEQDVDSARHKVINILSNVLE